MPLAQCLPRGCSQNWQPGLWFHLKTLLHPGGPSTPKLTHMVVGRLWSSPCGPPHRAAQSVAACRGSLLSPKQVIQVRKNKKGLPRRKPQSFYNLVSEVISHYISQYILFIRNESVSPICTLAEGTTQAHEYPGGGIIEAYLKGHLPHPP